MTNRSFGVNDRAVIPGEGDRRRAAGVATVVALITLTVAASIVAVTVDRNVHSYYVDEIVGGLVVSVTAVVGATIALARPRNVIGWLIVSSATCSAVAEALVESGVHGVLHPGTVGGAAYLVTFGVILRALPSVVLTAAVPAYFPDGQLPDRRWRWVRWALVGAVVFTVVGGVIAPIETRLGDHWHGPFTPAGSLGDNLQILDVLGTLFTLVAAVGAFAGLVSRWRRGGPVVRQQLLLFACAVVIAVLFLVGVMVVVVAVSNSGTPRYLFSLAGLPLPLAVAAATLNNGLYELRRAANRTILWLLVTVSIAAVYAVVVVLAATLSPGRSSWWPPALAAGAAALALVPVRDRLQRVVHRVVYGRWREPYEVLSGLAAQLEAAGDVDRLLEAAVAQLGSELDLTDVGVREASGEVLAGVDGGDEAVPLVAYGTKVGELRFRNPGRVLSESEQRLIRDLAVHLGGTVHARSLLEDLQRTRERLVLAREEERRRLRRDLHDGIGPALAGLTLKAETARALLDSDTEAAQRQLAELSEEIRSTVVDVRRVVEGLRPPALDELGLADACRQAVDRLTRAAGISPDVRCDLGDGPVPAAVEVAAFRIVTEAVTNVVRHAQARRCSVSLARDGSALRVVVCDDGTGRVDGSPSGHGLATMRERAEELGGSLSIGAADPGLRVTAVLPTRPAGSGS
jgi:signal transduction histidine kinase